MEEKEMLVHKSQNTDATNAACFSGGVEVLTGKRFPLLPSSFFHFVAALCYKFCTIQSRNPTNSHRSTMATFFCPSKQKVHTLTLV